MTAIVKKLNFQTGFDLTQAPSKQYNVALDLSEIAAGGELAGFLDAPTVDATHAGSAHHAQAHGPAQHTEGTAWRLVYQDANGDEQEIVLGAAATVLTSNGASAAPSFQAAAGGGDVPTVVRKTADEIVNSSTALQNDDDLFFAMAANTTYEFEMLLGFISNTTADFKFDFTVPAGAAMIFFCLDNAVADFMDNAGIAGTVVILNYASTTPGGLLIRGAARCGATPGNLQFRWAQVASTAINTTVYAASILKYWER